MSFARPELLWLLLLLPALAAAGVYGYARRRRRIAEGLGDPGLVARLGLGDLRFPAARLALIAGAAAALGLAAAGPQWGEEVVESRERSRSIVVAIDVSKSMLARDVEPDRLERGRLFMRRLLRELPGDRIGLVGFAGRAYVLSPLTVDHGALHLYLDALDPEVVSQGGSSLATAIRQATDLARGREQAGGDRAILLVSDGEALEDDADVLAAAERAGRAGVQVHTLGIGTPDGAPVPDRDAQTGRVAGYKRDPATGEVVVSRLNEELLEDVAERTGGRYTRIDQAGATDRVLDALRSIERGEAGESDPAVQARARFEWFVALALLLLAFDAIRSRRPVSRRETG